MPEDRPAFERLEARLVHLEAHRAIDSLLDRYGPFADAGEADAAASLWAQDGTYAFATAAGDDVELAGRSAIADMLKGHFHEGLMARGALHVTSSRAVSLSPTVESAVAVGYSFVVVHGVAGWDVQRASATRWELARSGAVWLISRRETMLLNGAAHTVGILGEWTRDLAAASCCAPESFGNSTDMRI